MTKEVESLIFMTPEERLETLVESSEFLPILSEMYGEGNDDQMDELWYNKFS